MIGIYCFTNLINKKQYIGQSINIQNRKNQHYYRFKNPNDNGYSMPIHLAFRKYGWENFSFEILEECSIEELDEKECFWIKEKNTLVPNGYNVLSGGQVFRPKKDKTKYICPKCKGHKDAQSKLCWNCYNKQRINNTKIPLEDFDIYLVERILDSSLEKVAKEYGYTSGNGLKKQLINHGYPGTRDKLFDYYEKFTGHKHWKEVEKEKKIKNYNKQKPKKVGQYDLNGTLIAIYNSTKDAQRNGFSSGHVSECCRGLKQKYKNYIWKYL